MSPKRQAPGLDIRHILAVLAGMICFTLVFMYTGAAELLIAFSSGLVASAAAYLAANLTIAMHSSKA